MIKNIQDRDKRTNVHIFIKEKKDM